MGKDGLAVVSRVGKFDGERFDPLSGQGGPIARAHSVAELGMPCDLAHGPPAAANLISLRNAPALYGLGLVDSIPDAVIRAGAVHKGPSTVASTSSASEGGAHRALRLEGRYSDTGAVRRRCVSNELGMTNPLAPLDLVTSPGCGGSTTKLDDDGTFVRAVTAYVAALPPPAARTDQQTEPAGPCSRQPVAALATRRR